MKAASIKDDPWEEAKVGLVEWLIATSRLFSRHIFYAGASVAGEGRVPKLTI